MPDAVVTPPITAESVGTGMRTALDRRGERVVAGKYIALGEAALKQKSVSGAQENFAAAVAVGGPDPDPC